MRLTVLATVLLLAGAAHAQAPLTGTAAPAGSPTNAATSSTGTSATAAPAPRPARRHGMTLQQRFDAANVTHDGHLTQEQARAKMPAVARDFAAIDTAGKGYVTVDEIRDYRRARRAARHAHPAGSAAKP